jgi:hypothetical protein
VEDQDIARLPGPHLDSGAVTRNELLVVDPEPNGGLAYAGCKTAMGRRSGQEEREEDGAQHGL